MFDTELPEMEPQWLEPLTALFGADGSTGWMDSDQALEAMAWLGRRVFEQSRIDRGAHTRAGLQAQVEATAAVTNSLAAVQAVRVAQYAATTGPGTGAAGFGAVKWQQSDEGDGAGVGADLGARAHGSGEVLHPPGFKAEFADVDLAPGMCWSPGQASNHLEEAIDAVTKTPRLLAEMGAGRFDAYRLSQVTRELLEAGVETCERVEDELLARGVTGWTSRRVQARAAAVVRRVDPPAQRRVRKRRAKQAIGVFTRAGQETGTTEWSAVLRSKEAWAAYQAVDELARTLHQGTTTDKTLGECRADAMVDLILANASVATQVTVLVPVKAHPNQAVPDDVTADDDAADDDPEVVADPGAGDGAGGSGADGASEGLEPVFGEVAPGSVVELEEVLELVDWDAELARLILASRVPWPPPRFADPGPLWIPGEPLCPQPAGAEQQPAGPVTRPQDFERSRSPRAEGSSWVPPGQGLLPDEVEVSGIGVIPAETVAEMLRTVGASVGRALVDQHTGTLLGSSCRSYRPTAGIRRQVVLRDSHCRFPGCERASQYCDADHVIAWPAGETRDTNLQLLCRHHHRAKHEGGWSVTMTPDGTCEWRSPTGRSYVTRPGLLDVLADVLVAPGSAPPQPHRVLECVPETGPPGSGPSDARSA